MKIQQVNEKVFYLNISFIHALSLAQHRHLLSPLCDEKDFYLIILFFSFIHALSLSLSLSHSYFDGPIHKLLKKLFNRRRATIIPATRSLRSGDRYVCIQSSVLCLYERKSWKWSLVDSLLTVRPIFHPSLIYESIEQVSTHKVLRVMLRQLYGLSNYQTWNFKFDSALGMFPGKRKGNVPGKWQRSPGIK